MFIAWPNIYKYTRQQGNKVSANEGISTHSYFLKSLSQTNLQVQLNEPNTINCEEPFEEANADHRFGRVFRTLCRESEAIPYLKTSKLRLDWRPGYLLKKATEVTMFLKNEGWLLSARWKAFFQMGGFISILFHRNGDQG